VRRRLDAAGVVRARGLDVRGDVRREVLRDAREDRGGRAARDVARGRVVDGDAGGGERREGWDASVDVDRSRWGGRRRANERTRRRRTVDGASDRGETHPTSARRSRRSSAASSAAVVIARVRPRRATRCIGETILSDSRVSNRQTSRIAVVASRRDADEETSRKSSASLRGGAMGSASSARSRPSPPPGHTSGGATLEAALAEIEEEQLRKVREIPARDR
jgi:hypothetical protein